MRRSGEVSAAEARARLTGAPAPKRNKFNAVRIGDFDSKHEANWITKLRTLQDQGYITNLRSDKAGLRFALYAQDGLTMVCQYTADARFTVVKGFSLGNRGLKPGDEVVLDAKSPPTRKKADYVIRKKLMMGNFGIEIVEV